MDIAHVAWVDIHSAADENLRDGRFEDLRGAAHRHRRRWMLWRKNFENSLQLRDRFSAKLAGEGAFLPKDDIFLRPGDKIGRRRRLQRHLEDCKRQCARIDQNRHQPNNPRVLG